jgi:predicted RNA binding protein YcfA (HicA-like mRNA interferase family)
MPKLPGIRHQDAAHGVFEKLGYRIIRQSGHIVMSNGETRLVIPRANPVDPFTMGAIARDAGMTPDEFRKLL